MKSIDELRKILADPKTSRFVKKAIEGRLNDLLKTLTQYPNAGE